MKLKHPDVAIATIVICWYNCVNKAAIALMLETATEWSFRKAVVIIRSLEQLGSAAMHTPLPQRVIHVISNLHQALPLCLQ